MRTVVVIIDALGAELARTHGFAVAGLAHGRRLESVLGFSQAALTSILTGVRPDRHGLWMMYAFDDRSPFRFLRCFPDALGTRRRIVRRLVRWKLGALDRVGAYYSLYDVPKRVLGCLDLPARRPLFEPGGGQGTPTVIDRAIERGDRCFVRDYRCPELEAFDDLDQALDAGRHDFHLLYTAGLDAVLHRFGTGHEETAKRLRLYEKRLGRIVSKCDRMIVLGDHGMCDVERTVDLIARVEALGLRVPRDVVPFYDATMARFRVRDARVRSGLEQLLGELGCGRILDEAEQRLLGVRFEDGRFGDLIFVVETGTVIEPSFMGRTAPAGMHGYHPAAPCMDSLMLSSELADGCRSITDVASLVLPGFAAGGAA
ncbi:MAG: alkaline phosphatase family protein [Candidatus Krumholzibacteriota bacterium]|nr:alkaline phosphatase family protein [Candidatus Krumholzibacteriota bacterium]